MKSTGMLLRSGAGESGNDKVKWENWGIPKMIVTEYSHLPCVEMVLEEGGKGRRTPKGSYAFSGNRLAIHSFIHSSLSTISSIIYHVSSSAPGTGETDE